MLTRQGPTGKGRRPGNVAGAVDSRGYVQLKVDGAQLLAHRVAWLLTHGSWPEGFIDHINGVRTDNRLVNLRIVTRSQNNSNRRKSAGATSRYRGVTWNARDRRWTAAISVDGKHRHIGNFKCETEAAAAYDAAARLAHGPSFAVNFPEKRPAHF